MSQLSNSSFLITFELESLLQFTGDLESLFSVCPDSIGRIAVCLLLCILKTLSRASEEFLLLQLDSSSIISDFNSMMLELLYLSLVKSFVVLCLLVFVITSRIDICDDSCFPNRSVVLCFLKFIAIYHSFSFWQLYYRCWGYNV